MALAIACEIPITITALNQVTDWKPSIGADCFVTHLQVTAGTCTVVLQACNIWTDTPKDILTVAAGGVGDFYAEMAAGLRYPYRYWRLKVTGFTGATAKAVATGTR